MGDRDRAASARQAGHILYGAIGNSPNSRYNKLYILSKLKYLDGLFTVGVNVTDKAEVDPETGFNNRLSL